MVVNEHAPACRCLHRAVRLSCGNRPEPLRVDPSTKVTTTKLVFMNPQRMHLRIKTLPSVCSVLWGRDGRLEFMRPKCSHPNVRDLQGEHVSRRSPQFGIEPLFDRMGTQSLQWSRTRNVGWQTHRPAVLEKVVAHSTCVLCLKAVVRLLFYTALVSHLSCTLAHKCTGVREGIAPLQ